MCFLKFSAGEYLNTDAPERVTHYIFDHAIAIGGQSVDPIHAAEQMHMVKNVWGQESGKQMHHFVLIFSAWESAQISNPLILIEIANHVCYYFSNEFQIIYGVHDNGQYHVHFAMNSVSFATGKKFRHNKRDDSLLAQYILWCCIPPSMRQKLHLKFIECCYN